MISAFVALGSNLDDPVAQLDTALAALACLPQTELVRVSRYFQSAPLDATQQPDFVNAVAELETRLEATELLRALLDIERAQGRQRGARWGPRRIDLDLLVHGRTTSSTAALRLPHPGIAERNFVLLPLREIAPELEIPGIGRIQDIAVDKNRPRIAPLDIPGRAFDRQPDQQQ